MTENPKYPVYVISKGRYDCGHTAKFLLHDKVPFYLVIEPQEEHLYREHIPQANLLITPFKNLGLGSIPVRNFIWEHSIEEGHERHWCFDDNIFHFRRFYKKQRIPMDSRMAILAMEKFIDRYFNLAIAAPNYSFFQCGSKLPPFFLNNHVYSCLCIDNNLPFRWRGRYNEDTDLCLQALSSGLCTVLFNAFLIMKAGTMTMKGGNSDQLYRGDGRLTMARSLERLWPGVVETDRRFGRPQHVIKNAWRKFDTQLIKRPDVNTSSLPKVDEMGMKLVQVADEIKSDRIKKLLDSSKISEDV